LPSRKTAVWRRFVPDLAVLIGLLSVLLRIASLGTGYASIALQYLIPFIMAIMLGLGVVAPFVEQKVGKRHWSSQRAWLVTFRSTVMIVVGAGLIALDYIWEGNLVVIAAILYFSIVYLKPFHRSGSSSSSIA